MVARWGWWPHSWAMEAQDLRETGAVYIEEGQVRVEWPRRGEAPSRILYVKGVCEQSIAAAMKLACYRFEDLGRLL